MFRYRSNLSQVPKIVSWKATHTEENFRNTIFKIISTDIVLNNFALKRSSQLANILCDTDFIKFAMKADKILGLYILAAVACNKDFKQICSYFQNKVELWCEQLSDLLGKFQ